MVSLVFIGFHMSMLGNLPVAPVASGTPQERLLHGGPQAGGQQLRCPAATKLIVQDRAGVTEELCWSSAGYRHGYYLRWSSDGQHWDLTGSYHQGQRHGAWRQWSHDRTSVTVTTFERGRVIKQRRVLVVPHIVASR